MAMITRCPACSTNFRVAPQQLQAQQGMVRCGRCMTVFDGFKTLSTEDEAPADAPSAQTASASAAPGEAGHAEAAPAEAAQPPLAPEPAFKLEPVSATELAAAAIAPPRELIPKSDAGDEARDFGPAPEQLTIEDHLFLEENRAARIRSARLWAAGALLLFLVLAAQAIYVYRGELAAHFPASRLVLARMCELAKCVVHLPQRPRLIVIEASDLQSSDPARPGVIQLTATVRNHAGYDVGFPAIDLVLTNTREHTLARRIFLPRDYLEPGRDVGAGIPAAAEVTIQLDLDTGDLNPSGFRLDLMAAPPP
jgi:predicted Zn finger-like uncharacterized protein